jgi:hypothetical protein
MPYMRVLQGMQNANGYYETYMRVLQKMPKKPVDIMETICGYYNE